MSSSASSAAPSRVNSGTVGVLHDGASAGFTRDVGLLSSAAVLDAVVALDVAPW
jgi:hypothetical protein